MRTLEAGIGDLRWKLSRPCRDSEEIIFVFRDPGRIGKNRQFILGYSQPSLPGLEPVARLQSCRQDAGASADGVS